MSELELFLNAAVAAAQAAGKVIVDAFDQEKHISEKMNTVDLVTETDQQCETLIIGMLEKAFPTHSFIGEESTAAGAKNERTDNPTWIIDPLDGTTNFIHRFPYVAVCIGLAINKVVQVAVVFNAPQNQMFTAIRGKGAFMNGKKLSVSKCNDIRKALLLTEIGSERSDPHLSTVRDNYYDMAKAPCHSIRSLGAAAMNMCTVATGAGDGYWEFGVHAWDYAAASLIVSEAGGHVCDTTGGPMDLMARKVLCAATEELALQMAKNIRQIPMPRD
eukprot:comp23667_c0_seq3/m.40470 comp23667_c0_seq3/g.40470  ORF comp23667_c0_seq3/g.40470 comp23667_c0_seq3/m.40470 type:complete len:274 (-) comp23667_c0_seq3:250-1071(-)